MRLFNVANDRRRIKLVESNRPHRGSPHNIRACDLICVARATGHYVIDHLLVLFNLFASIISDHFGYIHAL